VINGSVSQNILKWQFAGAIRPMTSAEQVFRKAEPGDFGRRVG
jgi:hypothetical protein